MLLCINSEAGHKVRAAAFAVLKDLVDYSVRHLRATEQSETQAYEAIVTHMIESMRSVDAVVVTDGRVALSSKRSCATILAIAGLLHLFRHLLRPSFLTSMEVGRPGGAQGSSASSAPSPTLLNSIFRHVASWQKELRPAQLALEKEEQRRQELAKQNPTAQSETHAAKKALSSADVVVASTALKEFYHMVSAAIRLCNAVVLLNMRTGNPIARTVHFLYAELTTQSRAHFRRKLRELTVRMLRKYDYSLLSCIWPERYHKLLSNARKLENRRKISKRKSASKDARGRSGTREQKDEKVASQLVDALSRQLSLGGGDADDDDDENEAGTATKATTGGGDDDQSSSSSDSEDERGTAQRITETDDNIVDFLDQQSLANQLR